MGNTAIYLLPGMSATITVEDAFAYMGEVPYKRKDTEEMLKTENGFILHDTDVGEIQKGTGASITYKHKKYSPNLITFYTLNGTTSTVDIISVPIHDHASIVTGGPAFGTYFSDDETVETKK